MKLSRFKMEKWCHAPFFSLVAKGAFVRINIGQNSGSPVYRIGEILDVVETSKVYQLGNTRTNKGLKLRHGTNERVFRLEYVSNSPVSDQEFKRWRETLIKQNIPLPTMEDVENKTKLIQKYTNYSLNEQDIDKIVQEKKRFRKTPINYAVKKKSTLSSEIDKAKDEANTELADELTKQLIEIEERASELDRNRSVSISVISQINRRNRRITQKNVETALIREAQEHRNAAPDPFTRRRCEPILVTKAPPTNNGFKRQLQEQRAADEALKKQQQQQKEEEEKLLAESKAPFNNDNNDSNSTSVDIKPLLPQKSSSTLIERGSFQSSSLKEDDMFASHDFDLDELDFPLTLL